MAEGLHHEDQSEENRRDREEAESSNQDPRDSSTPGPSLERHPSHLRTLAG
jgi:hypothetical protein